MMQRSILALVVAGVLAGASPSVAAEQVQPPRQKWSFSGPFGHYDRAQLQRGFKVYREVCQVCHGLNLLSFRNLGALGYNEAQVRQIASEYKIQDGPNDQGEMFERAGRPADRFPQPIAWKNEAQARTLYSGTVPPDMSVITKARTYERGFPWFVFDIFTQYQEQGPDYLVALLTGYGPPPAGVTLTGNLQYNKYFPGHAIAMPPPLTDSRVDYTDGTPQTILQYAKDVTAFLAWAAEPHLETRKRIGFQVMIFLIVFAGMLYFTKKKVWSAVH
jgi:ubiquinol-cytochrome c reductase cytochrome b/c1 subunit